MRLNMITSIIITTTITTILLVCNWQEESPLQNNSFVTTRNLKPTLSLNSSLEDIFLNTNYIWLLLYPNSFVHIYLMNWLYSFLSLLLQQYRHYQNMIKTYSFEIIFIQKKNNKYIKGQWTTIFNVCGYDNFVVVADFGSFE